jgi:hypothetical protein
MDLAKAIPIQLFVRASSDKVAGMNVRYRVELSHAEGDELKAFLSAGKLKRAQILIAGDAGTADEKIAISLGGWAARPSIEPSAALCSATWRRHSAKSRDPGASRKLSGKEQALLVATACSGPPAGRARWILKLLAEELVRLTERTGISPKRCAGG